MNRLKSDVVKADVGAPVSAHASNGKDVRDDDGFWEDVETYIRGRTEAEFTHSICPACKAKHFSTDGGVAEGMDRP